MQPTPGRNANLIVGGKPVDVPAHAAVVDPFNFNPDPTYRRLYVGTDVGCWQGIKRQDAATQAWNWTWSIYSLGLPECAITDLVIHPAGLLRAATHGRGVWEIAYIDPQMNAPEPKRAWDIYMRANYADSGRIWQGTTSSIWQGTTSGVAWGPQRSFSVLGESAPDEDPRNLVRDKPVALGESPDIKVRRASLTALSNPPNYLDFAFNIGEQFTTGVPLRMSADDSGLNKVYIQVHNRGLSSIDGSLVRVLLLVSQKTTMPTDYKTKINELSRSPSWLNGWFFADPQEPYHAVPGMLNVRTPQVVEYTIDFSKHNFQKGAILNLVAFAFTTTDQLTTTETDLKQAVFTDKHIVFQVIELE